MVLVAEDGSMLRVAAGELDPGWFAAGSRVGVTAGASGASVASDATSAGRSSAHAHTGSSLLPSVVTVAM